MIDIVVGGQYGDEGKGQVCAHLANKNNYKYAVRVSGSNAEHRFLDEKNKKHTARVLPVAAWIDPDIYCILGAGHMIKLESFENELQELQRLWGPEIHERILIDPQAGVIMNQHTKKSEYTNFRGSTHQGNGQAIAHKVLRDGTFKLAKDYPELERYLGNTVKRLDEFNHVGYHGLLEGAQGALLSLNHGYYPFNTAKDVTPAGLLAEAGIPTKYVRDTWAVYRAIPMRVPGNSGPTGGREIPWEELERRINKNLPDSVKIQTDSFLVNKEGQYERVFEWSWEDFHKSVSMCGPSHIVITFGDWWPVDGTGSVDTFDQLIKTIQQMDLNVAMTRSGPKFEDYKEL